MEERQLSGAFGGATVDYSVKLAIKRDLERLYSSVVSEPIPPQLSSFVERLGQAQERGVEEVESHGLAISDRNMHTHTRHPSGSALRRSA
jgi:hypothetical protein